VFGFNNSQLRRWKISTVILLPLLLVAEGCIPKPNPDSIKLDGFLSGALIDRVDLVSMVFTTNGLTFRTNALTGPEATKFLGSLMKTNRTDSPDTTKAQTELTAHLMHGTNALVSVDLFENGLWKIGDYSFRIRSVQ
jgi:hypothetical protein